MSGDVRGQAPCGCDAGAGEARPSAEEANAAGIHSARRWFLKSAAAFTTVALAPGVTLMALTGGASPSAARPPSQPASSGQRWGLLIDASRCPEGCSACVSACSQENGWKGTGHPRTDAQWIRKLTVRDPKSSVTRSVPMMCQHCASPPCVDVCPTGASFKRADGIVLVDKHICIGCRYCMMACPYKARSFIHEPLTDQLAHAPRGKGTVESCTLCVHRVDEGRTPACVEACIGAGHGAMMFGDLNDPQSEIAKRVATLATRQIRADLGLDPGVRYQNL
ncbi:MAG: 4Fe-4S dicluster domain-containing protein [Hyphomicrobiaceae bacterium]|nr:MAG: 4Fe-4S dicluster domain-containing protein [Hyphomicrobiaceae bacterium]